MAVREPTDAALTPTPQEQRQAYWRLLRVTKTRAIVKLAMLGRILSGKTDTAYVVNAIREATGRGIAGRTQLGYMLAFLTDDPFEAKKATPRAPGRFKPLRPDYGTQHNFERARQAQRPLITPNGYGDHSRSWGGSEGRS